MAEHSLAEDYAKHLAHKVDIYSRALNKAHYDCIVIASGGPEYRFRDDLYQPYFANAYFKEFISLPEHAHSFLVLKPGQKPSLYIQQHADFWHSEPAPLESDLSTLFDIYQYKQQIDIDLPDRCAFIGSSEKNVSRKMQEQLDVNPETLLAIIDFNRAWKTDYEIECMRVANIYATRAHTVAERYFREGYSEYEIHMAYLAALSCREAELPYDNIIALNEHAAVLHHMHLDKSPPQQARSFLIDAGAEYRGYAADITRSYTTADANHVFAQLITALNKLQLNIIEQIKVGQSYVDLHHVTHTLIAGILSDFKLVKVGAEEAYECGLTRAFFPHGLGHLIGIQVHDQGGHLADDSGTKHTPPDTHPFLRLTRKIENNMAFTIEPGLYFIPSLLAEWRGKGVLNEDLIDNLIPYGGIRIEDDVVVQADKVVNLTREAFAAN